jgi:hypothetical protein
MALPIPFAPPVIIATLPSKLNKFSIFRAPLYEIDAKIDTI